jgi:hypothetical protein
MGVSRIFVMTDVQKTNTRKISSVEDALPLYAPPSVEYTGKMGAEVEMPLMKPGKGKPAIPTALEMQALQTKLKAKGYDAQLEPAGVLEYASPAVAVGETAALLTAVKKDLAIFEGAANDDGFTRSPFSIVPTTTKEEALRNMVSRERLQVSLKAMQEIFDANTLRLPMLTSSVQTSFSPKDPDEMFRMVYRAYALTPLLMAATASSSGYIVNEDERLDYLPRGKYYLGYGDAGGISPGFLKSSTGAEFIRNHIEEVFNAPMHFAYNPDGSIIPSTAEDRLTFKGLAERGLNTLSNFELAETFLYNDVKVCNLRDEQGKTVGKRMEVRGADSGIDQPVMGIILAAMLVPEGPAAKAFDALLKDYGFTGDPKTDAPLFLASRTAAVDNGGKFMDVAFGTGRLRDFAQDVAGIIATWANVPQSDLARLTDVLMTGNCDAKIFAEQFGSLAEVTTFLQKDLTPKQDNAPAVKRSLR